MTFVYILGLVLPVYFAVKIPQMIVGEIAVLFTWFNIVIGNFLFRCFILIGLSIFLAFRNAVCIQNMVTVDFGNGTLYRFGRFSACIDTAIICSLTFPDATDILVIVTADIKHDT